jgi:hypothetical protein
VSLPRITPRISLAKIPWLHGGVQDATIDAPDLATKLATLVDPSDPQLRLIFQRFFENTSHFDRAACQLTKMNETLHFNSRSDFTLQMLGIPRNTTDALLQDETTSACRWAARNVVPVALADHLAWVADPDNHARATEAQPFAIPIKTRRMVRA